MNVFQVWMQSLDIFKPSSMKIFFYITAKSILRTCSALLHYHWWLIGIMFLLSIAHRGVLCSECFVLVCMPLFATYFLYIFFAFLSARSSVPQKNSYYFMHYTMYLVPFFFGAYSLFKAFEYVQAGSFFLPSFIRYTMLAGLFLCVQMFVFYMFFLLDSEGHMRSFGSSLWRAAMMFVYNLPVVLVLSTCMSVIVLPFLYFCPGGLVCFWFIVLLPIPITVFSNLYIKCVHEQFVLYFGEPKRV